MASTQISRSVSSTGSITKGTLSVWFKRTTLDTEQFLFYSYENGNNNGRVRISSDNKLEVEGLQGGSQSYTLRTSRIFADPNFWYHVVVAYDSTNSTAADRIKIYINGEDQANTAEGDTTENRANPSSSANMSFNENGSTVYIGGQAGSNYFEGSMSHYHWIDGTTYDASTFGSTDSTTGEWKINANPTLTMGTNGFTILKDDATITDQSSNSNNFSASTGSLTATTDCPSNCFTNWNSLNRDHAAGIQNGGYGHAGTYLASETSNNNRSFGSSMAFPGNGKFYIEFKIGNKGTGQAIGIGETENMISYLNNGSAGAFSQSATGWEYANSGAKETNGSSASYGDTYDSGDFIGLAYNNGALWFSKNGTWQNSATITEIQNGTTTNAAYTGIDTTKDYFVMWRGYNDAMIEMNAGQGYFRTTAAGTNNPSTGDTSAKFKYTVPTGFQPISTKGLNA